jgi:hypothetical protein
MNLITLAMMILGVAMSALSGMICYVGPFTAAGSIDWVPHADLMLYHPQACLGIGAVLLVLGMAMQPTRA